jgi:hypothetical protein
LIPDRELLSFVPQRHTLRLIVVVEVLLKWGSKCRECKETSQYQ